MALNLELVGNKIRRYREQLQLSIDELSHATGIASEAIRSYELGVKEPTGDEILIFADFFRCDYRFFISNEKLAPFEETEKLYRRYGEDFSKLDRKNMQDFLFLCENEEYLINELGYDGRRRPFAFRKTGSHYKTHGKDAAAELRRHLGYSDRQVGMNIYEDIRAIGVHIFRRRLGNSNISGLYIRHPTAGKCVLINYSEDVYRQRFTAGHEVAHAILDDEEDFVVSFEKWDRNDLVEIRANTFSSQYLMPPEFLKSISQIEGWSVEMGVEWAGKLKVSTQALAYALLEEKLVNKEFVRGLRSRRVPIQQKVDPELPPSLSERSRKRKEQLLELGLSDYYVGLCFEAYHKDIISRGRLAECLLIDPVELKDISGLYGRSLMYGS